MWTSTSLSPLPLRLFMTLEPRFHHHLPILLVLPCHPRHLHTNSSIIITVTSRCIVHLRSAPQTRPSVDLHYKEALLHYNLLVILVVVPLALRLKVLANVGKSDPNSSLLNLLLLCVLYVYDLFRRTHSIMYDRDQYTMIIPFTCSIVVCTIIRWEMHNLRLLLNINCNTTTTHSYRIYCSAYFKSLRITAVLYSSPPLLTTSHRGRPEGFWRRRRTGRVAFVP
jgi:hypothetical protein